MWKNEPRKGSVLCFWILAWSYAFFFRLRFCTECQSPSTDLIWCFDGLPKEGKQDLLWKYDGKKSLMMCCWSRKICFFTRLWCIVNDLSCSQWYLWSSAHRIFKLARELHLNELLGFNAKQKLLLINWCVVKQCFKRIEFTEVLWIPSHLKTAVSFIIRVSAMLQQQCDVRMFWWWL